MACIVAGILSLLQHKNVLETNPEIYRLKACPYPDCGKSGLWRHGSRSRKSDRENGEGASLNPILILRLYCPSCKRTCSVLPECIAPFRWHLWEIQQKALELYLAGINYNKISEQIKPSRWSISRWTKRLKEQFNLHTLYLKTQWPWLGYYRSLNNFWSALLEKINLSQAMLFLNNQTIPVP